MQEIESALFDGDRLGRKIDLQPIIQQQSGADQDLVAIDKRRLRANHPAIEWEIDKIDVFLDSLISCKK